MHFITKFINAVKTTQRARIAAGHVITIVGKLLTRSQTRSFADDFVAFDNQMVAIAVLDHPLTAEQGDDAIRGVVNRHKVDEGVRFVRGQGHAPVVINELIEAGAEAR